MNVEQACQVECELTNEGAPFFEEKVVPIWQEMYSSLIVRARIKPGARVLDLGTGTGEVAIRASKLLLPDGHVTGVDLAHGMIRVAEEKRSRLVLRNIEFRTMSMEHLEFEDNMFDNIVSNYSLCCTFYYDRVLHEAFRVLKPDGRLVYNHYGPNDPDKLEVLQRVFEKFKTKTPSPRLKRIRDADALQDSMWSRYRDPILTLNLMRGIGFKNVEAAITYHSLKFPSAESYVDYKLLDWKWEVDEMPEYAVKEFREEANAALSALSEGSTFNVNVETVYFIGFK